MFSGIEARRNYSLPVALVVCHLGFVRPKSRDKWNMWVSGGVFSGGKGSKLRNYFDKIGHQSVIFFEQHKSFDMRKMKSRKVELPPPVVFYVDLK